MTHGDGHRAGQSLWAKTISSCLIPGLPLMSEETTPIQPLHPSFISKLDPEYIEFHNKYLQYLPIYHTVPWNPEFRNGLTVPGSTPPLEVGKVQDYDLAYTNFRTFTPLGEAPPKGWPLFIFFHGGGYDKHNESRSVLMKSFE